MIKAKPEIMATPSAYHGAFDYDELAQLGYSPDEVIDFSVNSNPYGPPASVREAIANVPLDRYPDKECLALRQKLAEHHHVGIENIVVGNGTAELLLLIAMAFIRAGDKVLIVEPTFSEYERVAELAGAIVEKIRWQPEDMTNFKNLVKRIQAFHKEVIDKQITYFCNPNNPTGTFLNSSTFDLCKDHPETLYIIDEAYTNFMQSPRSFVDHPDVQIDFFQSNKNLITVHSLTKDYAIAGLRLGYAIGHPDIIEAIRLIRPAWNVNGLAQAAGLAVLDETQWLRKTVLQLHRDKDELVHGLQQLGFAPLPSAVHYFLVEVWNATQFRSRLLKHKIMVRDCTSFGLPDYIRISTRKPEDNQKLLDAIKAIQNDS